MTDAFCFNYTQLVVFDQCEWLEDPIAIENIKLASAIDLV